MINLYAYTYPAARKEFPGYILTKVGDTHREIWERLNEQGGAAEWQGKILIGGWEDLVIIERDYEIHKILEERGLHHFEDGKGTEWFKIPAQNDKEVFEYLDAIIKEIEGRIVRKSVKMRGLQVISMAKTLEIIEKAVAQGKDVATVIANLCPRFGKTIWALMLFKEINKKYGNNVMMLPAYWLSSHTSFLNELKSFNDFLDMVHIDTNDTDAENQYVSAKNEGKLSVITFSLHGNDLEVWKNKYGWIRNIPLEMIFSFIDEGDFGAHTENQQKKFSFLFDRP